MIEKIRMYIGGKLFDYHFKKHGYCIIKFNDEMKKLNYDSAGGWMKKAKRQTKRLKRAYKIKWKKSYREDV